MSSSSSSEYRSVSTIFNNIELLLTQSVPKSAQIIIGARWSFGMPRNGVAFSEFSFPLNGTPFLAAIEKRTGLCVSERRGGSLVDLLEYINSGGSAIVAVDSYYLPYRPAYQKVHASRTIIVRKSGVADSVFVEDSWKPAYSGTLLNLDLEKAWDSEVPRDLFLEPIFSGMPLGRRWWSVAVRRLDLDDPVEWSAGILKTLCYECTCQGRDPEAIYGLTAFRKFISWVEDLMLDNPTLEEQSILRAMACLILRGELSSRVYLCSFLKAAAFWLTDSVLSKEATEYYHALRYMEQARDVLAKSVSQFSVRHADFALECLRAAYEREERILCAAYRYA